METKPTLSVALTLITVVGFTVAAGGAFGASTGTTAVDSSVSHVASLNATGGTVTAGENVTVEFNVTNTNDSDRGYVLNLTIPDGFSVVDVYNDTGEWKASGESWVWITISAHSSKKPNITLQAPEFVSGDFTLNGQVKVSDPEQGIAAEDNATITVKGPSLTQRGGSVDPASVEEETTVTHDVGAVFENISQDGNTDTFNVTFPDAVAGGNLSVSSANVTNLADGSDVSISSSVSKVDGPDGDGVMDTLTFAVSPDATGTIDVMANVTVDISWPSVSSDTTYTIQASATDSTTGSVSSTNIADVTVNNEPANVTVAIDSTNSPVNETENLSVTATLSNVGKSSASQSITLSVGGTQRDSTTINLASGASTTVTLSWATGSGDGGTYTATVASANDSASSSVRVNSLPTASFSASPTHPNVSESVTLDASGSSDSEGSISSYEWDLDNDGSYDDATGATVTTNFSSAGDNTVGLRVTDSDGATSTANVTITVNGPPTAAFSATPDSPTVDENVTFNASSSTDADGTITSYMWDLDGDGSYDDATGVTANTSYGTSGNITVGLMVVDDDGASDTAAKEISVQSGPETVSSGQPGFGIAVAVIALLAVVLFARRRN